MVARSAQCLLPRCLTRGRMKEGVHRGYMIAASNICTLTLPSPAKERARGSQAGTPTLALPHVKQWGRG
jgi:hypothetical protein